MDSLISDFSQFVKKEFDLDVEPRELKKIIGNHTVMFKTFQIIMLKFKSKHNGELMRKRLVIDEKRSTMNKLLVNLNKVQADLLEMIRMINERKCALRKAKKLKEFYEFKQVRVKQMIKLLEQILKASEQEVDLTANLNKIDKNIALLNLKVNLDDIDEKFVPPPQINYNLVEKQIEEFIKDVNGSIYEITELMKNEDFVLELEEDFIENLTRTDYKVDKKPANDNIEAHRDKRLAKLSKNFESFKEKTDGLYNKHKNKVFDMVKKVEEQSTGSTRS